MPQPQHSAETKPASPLKPKAPAAALLSDPVAMAERPCDLAAALGDGSPNLEAILLGTVQMQREQRTQLAGQIALLQGNQHLLRLLGEASLPGREASRRFEPGRAGQAPSALVSRQPAGASPSPEPPGPRPLITDDDAGALLPGQVRKSEFLDRLRAQVSSTADAALAGTGRSSAGCPYLNTWFAFYRAADSQHVERAVHRYAPGTASATSADQCIPIICERVRSAVSTWVETGEITGVPEDLRSAVPGAGSAEAAGEHAETGTVQTRPEPGEAGASASPERIRAALGAGQALDSTLRIQMEKALGSNLSGVRVHADARSARLAREVGARAFAVGEHVAFGAGQYRPGNPIGDVMLAHELAHTVQQAQAARVVQADQAAEPTEEREADTSALRVALGMWAGLRGGVAELGREAVPRLRSGLALRRCTGEPARAGPSSTTAPATVTPPGPSIPTTVAGPSLLAGATLPEASTQAFVAGELRPGMFAPAPAGPTPTATPPAVLPWDGLETDAAGRLTRDARQARRDLTNGLLGALRQHLNQAMPGIRATSRARRVPVANLEGAGRAAKLVVDARFGRYASAAALTPSQASARAGFSFTSTGPDPNLMDAYDPAARARAGVPISASSVAWWMVSHDPNAASLQETQHFDPNQPGSAEETFLIANVLTPFVNSRRRDLELYDRFGFALAPQEGLVMIGADLPAGLSRQAGSGGTPSAAERAVRWGAWLTLIHEYIHTLEHSAFSRAKAQGGEPVMTEGFCEMFTKEVIDAELPRVPGNVPVRSEVEGVTPPPPPPTPDMLPATYASADEYVADRQHAEAIRGRIGPDAVRAAFFLGHVEFLGLQRTGALATPAPAGAANRITVPAGVGTLAALSAATNVPEADITAANTGQDLTVGLPAQLSVPGCRDHVVVESTDAAGRRAAETRAQIAAQNGVSEADLARANPTRNWAALAAGDRVLVPRP